MSATQVVLLILVLVAFVIGWVARGRRETAETARASAYRRVGEVDAALGASLTSFQAALGLWQIEGAGTSAHAERAIATFEARRAAVAQLPTDAGAPAQAQEALARALVALERLAEGLAAYSAGAALDAERERALLRAERTLTAARGRFLLAAAAPEPPRITS